LENDNQSIRIIKHFILQTKNAAYAAFFLSLFLRTYFFFLAGAFLGAFAGAFAGFFAGFFLLAM